MLQTSLLDASRQLNSIFNVLCPLPEAHMHQLFITDRIGAHIRHVHDHLRALISNLDACLINYNDRSRDSLQETDIFKSRQEQKRLENLLQVSDLYDRDIIIISEINCSEEENIRLKSTLYRELLYLINHTIHHVAIIKQILSNRDIHLPNDIGLAPSTATYQRELIQAESTCAQ